MLVNINDVIYFSQFNVYCINYYLNLYSFNVECIECITNKLDVSVEYFRDFYYEYNYIPLPVVDKVAILKSFIKSMNNQKYLDYFANKPDDELWISFDKKFENCFERRAWEDYLQQRKIEIIKLWCNENNIRMS